MLVCAFSMTINPLAGQPDSSLLGCFGQSCQGDAGAVGVQGRHQHTRQGIGMRMGDKDSTDCVSGSEGEGASGEWVA